MNSIPSLEELRRMDEEWLRIKEARETRECLLPSSGFTKETLRETLAAAKAVRAQALTNARQALEEAFQNALRRVCGEIEK